jgi:hypothetical protein
VYIDRNGILPHIERSVRCGVHWYTKIPNTEVPAYEQFWLQEFNSLQSEYKDIVAKYPEANIVLKQVYKVLGDIVSLARCSPASVGTGTQWSSVVDSAKLDRVNLCQCLKGKSLFSALYGPYTVTLSELKGVLQQSVTEDNSIQGTSTATGTPAMKAPEDGFREQSRRRRDNSTDNELHQRGNKKATPPEAPKITAQAQKAAPATRNYFAPLRTAEMEAEEEEGDSSSEQQQQATSAKTGRPPPVMLSSAINPILLQNQPKGILKCNFEFRSTRNGTRVFTCEMADYSAIRAHFDSNNLHCYTYHLKSEKPIKAVIRHLPGDTPAEDISNGLQDLGFSVLSVNQLTATRPLPEGGSHTVNLPLFLITLSNTPKSQDILS